MSFCSKCGTFLPDEAVFCPNCGAKNIDVNYQNNIEQKVQKIENTISNTVSGINNTINYKEETNNIKSLEDIRDDIYKSCLPILSEDEKIVKHYHCASVKWPNSEGFLTVTNKRVIFHATDMSGASRISSEVMLDSVSGISCLIGRNIKIGKLLLGLIIFILSFMLMDISKLIGIIMMAVGIITFIFGCRTTYELKIYSSKANGSPINLGEGATTLVGNSALYSISCTPTTGTKKMIKEIGALIIDLQTSGDYAIEKWTKNN